MPRPAIRQELSLNAPIKLLVRTYCSATEFDLSMSRSDIGNHLGIAEETVCRVFARFQDDGLISSRYRRVKLNDLERLKQIAYHRRTSNAWDSVDRHLET